MSVNHASSLQQVCRWSMAALAAWAVAGCAQALASTSVPGPGMPGKSAPGRADQRATGYVLSGMPLVRQTYNACGPASLAQVLNYFGIPVSLTQVSQATRPNERAYMSAQAIVRYAPTVGMAAALYAGGSLHTVRRSVTNRLPLIVLQDLHLSGRVIPHWRVVVGFDDARQVVYLMDPLLGYVLMPFQDFMQVWAPHRYQFAVVYPPAWAALVTGVVR